MQFDNPTSTFFSFMRATSKAKRATLFLFSVTVLLAGGAAFAHAQDLEGTWGGSVTQDKPHETYVAQMTLNGSGGSISYPSLGCSGTLEFLGKSGETYVYREHITSGSDRCFDGGTIRATPSGNSLGWEWTGGGIAVGGTLSGERKVSGFTGKKVVHMTAKSWIDPASISLLISFKGVSLRLGANDEPTVPSVASGRNDYKLYQTFVAEAEFTNGKVVSAKFLPESLDIRAAKTFGSAQGLVYVKESTISAWKDQESVTFTRSVGGRPALLFSEPLASKEGFRDIYNTISVEIKGDKVTPHGYGSDFPSHRFWMNDTLMSEKRQVQPSDWFR